MENQTLSHYRIISKLGSGGMGDVYLAEDTTLHRRVALKLLPAEFTQNEERLWRFKQEARAVSSLNHPNILTIYEVGEADGHYFIATEFIDGKTLRQRLKSGDRMKTSEALALGEQVASALAAAHDAGIVHRDIKPENIMLRPDGYVKVLDFGLAKLAETAGTASDDTDAPTQPLARTEAGVIMGTLQYMSPEQARGLAVDARTDIWSLGCVLYEMAAGRAPFAAATVTDILVAIVEKEPPPFQDSGSADVPAEFDWIIRKALRKNADERYQRTRDLLVDLQRLRKKLDLESHLERAAGPQINLEKAVTNVVEGPSEAQVVRTPRGILTRRVAILAVLLVTLISGAIALLWYRRQASVMPSSVIKSLAVLPLKSLDAGDNYLGLGIADAVIRRINQTGLLLVRPTSAVRRYLTVETDALTAARQLSADAVLEGSVQRAEDRLRVSVNLLRTSDGASLWADKFDLRMTDIFAIQDNVAQQVASSLRLQLNPMQQAGLTKRYTSNALAYELFLKGLYSFDQRMTSGRSTVDASIEFLTKAVDADPNFALAHGQLAIAYASKVVFFDPTKKELAEKAREEISRAQALDPQIAETHLAQYVLLYSAYEGYQGEAAVREVRLAQQLNPNIGHAELGYLYTHLGLDDLAAVELRRAAEIDPTSDFVKGQTLVMYEMGGRYDEWFTAHQKFYPNEPPSAWYFLGKGRLDDAANLLERQSAVPSRNPREVLPKRAVLFALRGDFRSAEAAIPSILSLHPVKDPYYHHAAYDIACIYALEGKSAEAVKWMREAYATGFQCYQLFIRDEYLNRIRQAPEFIQFMAEAKAQNEKYRREFS